MHINHSKQTKKYIFNQSHRNIQPHTLSFTNGYHFRQAYPIYLPYTRQPCSTSSFIAYHAPNSGSGTSHVSTSPLAHSASSPPYLVQTIYYNAQATPTLSHHYQSNQPHFKPCCLSFIQYPLHIYQTSFIHARSHNPKSKKPS